MRWRLGLAALLVVAAACGRPPATPRSWTVAERLEAHGSDARARMGPGFRAAGVAYPPGAVVLVGLKREREIQVYAGPSRDRVRHVFTVPVRAASGRLGPKLREGDRQVPEGLYPIESLNPNSRFHVSLRIGYPNADDRARARAEGRTQLGGDIMIHGSAVSIGCLAVGDVAAEDLFVLFFSSEQGASYAEGDRPGLTGVTASVRVHEHVVGLTLARGR